MTLARQQQRRDTAANWALYNPVLLDGELGVDATSDRIKVGDGVTSWDALPYADRLEDSQAAVTTAQAAAVESQAAAAGARDISNIAVSDDVVEALIKGTAGAGPKTRTALSASKDERNYVYAGTSHILGTGIPPTRNLPAQVMDGIPNATVHNFAVHGQTTAEMISGAAQIDAAFVPGISNYLIFSTGSNEGAQGADPNTTYSQIEGFVQDRVDVGWIPIALTQMPRPDWDETNRNTLNNLLRTQLDTAQVVDTDTIPALATRAALEDTSIFFDRLHLSVVGTALVAGLVRTALNQLGVKTAQTRTTLEPAKAVISLASPDFRPALGATTGIIEAAAPPHYWQFPDVPTAWVIATARVPADWRTFNVYLIVGTEGTGTVTWQVALDPCRLGTPFTSSGDIGGNTSSITVVSTVNRTPILTTEVGNLRVNSPLNKSWSIAVRRNNTDGADGNAPAYLFGVELRQNT